METLAFDTGPLSHFARQNWLGVLKAVVGDRRALIPQAVEEELVRGAAVDSRLRAVLEADWLDRRPLAGATELEALAPFAQRLVVGDRNLGEAEVLALAQTLPAVAVIDDAAGRRAAQDFGVAFRPTLALLCEAIRSGLLTTALVSALADDLLVSDYRLPFGVGGFQRWADENGLV